MSIARSVADVLRDHVALEYAAIDRMYLNVYVPHVQTVGAMVGYLRVHRGQRFASTTAVAPMTEAFVRNIEQFVAAEGVDLVAFEKGQRKDDVTQKYLRQFRKSEGVLYAGKAQEKARVMRTERRRCSRTGATYLGGIGLDPRKFATHSMPNQSNVDLSPYRQPARGPTFARPHSKIESMVRYLGVEVDDALEIVEKIDV